MSEGTQLARRGSGPDRPPKAPPKPPPPGAGAGVAAAVEWRAASPQGEQLGPTVPTVFAQWIRSGQIGPDWLVWRSDWTDWRTAAEAAADLPAPLIGVTPESTGSGTPADHAATAVKAATSAQPKPSVSATEFARRRRRTARRRMSIALALAAVTLVMGGVLVYLVLAG